MLKHKTRVIQMYSFKGGAGRTVTSANVSQLLAEELAQRVVLIDMDIESAGSSVLLMDSEQREHKSTWTIQDVIKGEHIEDGVPTTIRHSGDSFNTNWDKLRVRLHGEQSDVGTLDLVPARQILQTASEAPFSDARATANLHLFLTKIRNRVTPNLIVLDSPSGIQDAANALFGQADVIVVFMRWSRQFISGTSAFLRHHMASSGTKRKLKKVVLVPTAVPVTKPKGHLAREVQKRQSDIDSLLFSLNEERGDPDFFKILPPIRECSALKWDDRVFLRESEEVQNGPGVAGVMEDYRRLAKDLVDIAGGLK